MGTFKKKKKKLSLDCMCMYIDIFFFFLSGKTGQTLCAGFYCACLGRFKKSVILDISFFFFPGPPVGSEFQTDRLLFLFDAVVWNPFIMKTTFTSDLSWFVSNIWEHLLYIDHFY